jgi:hypothetical protein
VENLLGEISHTKHVVLKETSAHLCRTVGSFSRFCFIPMKKGPDTSACPSPGDDSSWKDDGTKIVDFPGFLDSKSP